ncbi:MAG: ABC transporter permease [Kiritimatiellaeota bacterium]|nr:ABC transporter permease [Kiritimatiellota bacterium]
MSDILTCAVRELARRRLRALATILGYGLAAGVAIVAWSVLVCSRNTQNRILANTGTHFMAWVPAALNCGKQNPALDPMHEGFLANTIPTMLFDTAVAGQAVAQRDCIRAAAPYLLFRFKEPADGHLFTVGGFDPQDIQVVGDTCCAKADLVAGNFLETDSTGLILLEQGYAQGRGLRVGQTMTIASRDYTVAGIVNPGVRPAKADVYMLFRDAEQAISRRLQTPLRDQANVLLVHTVSSVTHDAAIAQTLKLLDAAVIESCGCYNSGSVSTSYACYKPAAQVLGMNEGTLKLAVLILGLGALVFAAKSQMAAVIERRRDIGILKAIGWTNRHVLLQVLTEAALQSVMGSALGCLVALVCVHLIPVGVLGGTGAMPISRAACLVGVLVTLIGGLGAGSLPAFRAARQNPADALRRL